MRYIFLITALATLSLIVTALAMATPASAAVVPADWYALPESAGEAMLTTVASEPDDRLKATLGRIFSAQRDALSSVSDPMVLLAPPKNKPADWVPWRFVSFVSDLSVSVSGLLGILSFKGTPSVSIYWQKREHFVNSTVNLAPDTASDIPEFILDPQASDTAATNQVDAIYHTVMASGRVRNGNRVRAGLTTLVGQFRDMTKTVSASAAATEWYPSRLRAEIEISASGRVNFGTVGGAVRVRLEWFPVQHTAPVAHFVATTTQQSSLFDLIASMAEDLSALSDTPVSPGFRASSFFVGLGIGASGTIGVAKGSAQAFGYVHFSRNAKAKPKLVADGDKKFSNASFYLIDAEPSRDALLFAERKGIKMLTSSEHPTVFKIDRSQFRAGLKKAFRIGGYFAKQASENMGPQWAISDVKPGFTMSVSGGLGLATMTGSVTAQIDFQNLKF